MAKITKIIDATKHLKLLRKDEHLAAVPVLELACKRYLEIDPEEMSFKDYLELLRKQDIKNVYYVTEAIDPEEYSPVDIEALIERADEVFEWDGEEEREDFVNFLTEYCDRYNESVMNIDEEELFIVDFFAHVDRTCLLYHVGLTYDKNYVMSTDEFLDVLDYLFFEGELFEEEDYMCECDEECECGHHHHHECCGGEDCDCE